MLLRQGGRAAIGARCGLTGDGDMIGAVKGEMDGWNQLGGGVEEAGVAYNSREL